MPEVEVSFEERRLFAFFNEDNEECVDQNRVLVEHDPAFPAPSPQLWESAPIAELQQPSAAPASLESKCAADANEASDWQLVRGKREKRDEKRRANLLRESPAASTTPHETAPPLSFDDAVAAANPARPPLPTRPQSQIDMIRSVIQAAFAEHRVEQREAAAHATAEVAKATAAVHQLRNIVRFSRDDFLRL